MRNPSQAVALFLTLALLPPSPALALRAGQEEESPAAVDELQTALASPSGLEETSAERREFLGAAGAAAATAALFGWEGLGSVLAQGRPGAPAIAVIPGVKLKGFGIETPAGRAGEILRVTSLEDSGPGTLREALEKKGPRVIVFDTSGTITLRKPLDIRNGNVRISAQTAPGPVILRGAGLMVRAPDVLVEQLAIRVGDDPGGPRADLRDAVQILGPEDPRAPSGVEGASRFVFYRCSFSWGIDGVAGLQFAPKQGAFVHCSFEEALQHAGHPKDDGKKKGGHSKGLLIAEGCEDILVYGCLFAHNFDRNPGFVKKGAKRIAFLNNVVYNGGRSRLVDIGSKDRARWWTGKRPEEIWVGVEGNAFIAGPDSQRGAVAVGVLGEDLDPGTQVYVQDSRLVGVSREFSTDASFNPRVTQRPDWMKDLPALSSKDVVEYVLARAGTGHRDSVDRRVIKQVRDTIAKGIGEWSGRIIDSPKDVGGWPESAPKKSTFQVPAKPNDPAGSAGYTQMEKALYDAAKALEKSGEAPAKPEEKKEEALEVPNRLPNLNFGNQGGEIQYTLTPEKPDPSEDPLKSIQLGPSKGYLDLRFARGAEIDLKDRSLVFTYQADKEVQVFLELKNSEGKRFVVDEEGKTVKNARITVTFPGTGGKLSQKRVDISKFVIPEITNQKLRAIIFLSPTGQITISGIGEVTEGQTKPGAGLEETGATAAEERLREILAGLRRAEQGAGMVLVGPEALAGSEGVPALAPLLLALKESRPAEEWAQVRERVIAYSEDSLLAKRLEAAGYHPAREIAELNKTLEDRVPRSVIFYMAGDDWLMHGDIPAVTDPIPLTPQNFLSQLGHLLRVLGYVPPAPEKLKPLSEALRQSA